MKEIRIVFRHERSLFFKDKGMLFYYLITILILGYISPLFIHNLLTCSIMAIVTVGMLLKPLLADSFAAEKEHRTLESLLSTPIQYKHILYGKGLFCFAFTVVYFSIIYYGIAIINLVGPTGYERQAIRESMSNGNRYELDILVIFLGSLVTFYTINMLGVYVSSRAASTVRAKQKVSLIVYPLLLMLVVVISVSFTEIKLGLLIALAFIGLVNVILLLSFKHFITHAKPSDSNEKSSKTRQKRSEYISLHTPLSQFSAVVRHEMRYAMKLHYLQINYLFLTIAPAVFLYLFASYENKVDLNYAVLITALMMPRVPMNLVSYAIGGEKVYRTGESLLSTPLSARSIFLGKSIVPILVSAFTLVVSSVISIEVGCSISQDITNSAPRLHYSSTQCILLFPVTMLTCILMIFITAILSAVLKTPRQGLYVSSIIGSLFILPVFVILYLPGDSFGRSIGYCIFLLLCNLACILIFAEKISRPKLISRL